MDPNRLTEKAQEAIRQAQTLAQSQSHPQIEVEHLAMALLGQPNGVAARIVAPAGLFWTDEDRAVLPQLASYRPLQGSHVSGCRARRRLSITATNNSVKVGRRRSPNDIRRSGSIPSNNSVLRPRA